MLRTYEAANRHPYIQLNASCFGTGGNDAILESGQCHTEAFSADFGAKEGEPPVGRQRMTGQDKP